MAGYGGMWQGVRACDRGWEQGMGACRLLAGCGGIGSMW